MLRITLRGLLQGRGQPCDVQGEVGGLIISDDGVQANLQQIPDTPGHPVGIGVGDAQGLSDQGGRTISICTVVRARTRK